MTAALEPDIIPPRSRWRIVALCCAALATLSFTTVGLAMCIPAIAAEMRLDYARQGLLLSAAAWPFVLGMVGAGAADRLGFRIPFFVGALVQITGWFLAARAGSFPQAIFAIAVLGAGGAIVDALVTPIVCRVYPGHRTRINNLLHGFYPLGLVASAGLVLALQSADVPWRLIFRGFGLLCIPYAVAAAVLRLPSQARGGQRLQVRGLLVRPIFLALLLAMVMAGATEMGPANWLPTFALDSLPAAARRQNTQVVAGLGLALFGGLMATGRFSASALAGRIGVHKLMLAAAAVCALCLGIAAAPVPRTLAVACLAFTGLGVSCLWPTLMALAGDRFPLAGASIYSALSACGALGCAIGPAVVGWIGDAAGRLGPALATLAAAPAIIFAIILLLRSDRSGNAA